MPKTGGTTTDRLFELSGLPLLWRDSQTSPCKHWPASAHSNLPSLKGYKKLVNIRRLPEWLLSNWQHKNTLMGLDLGPERMREGLFYRNQDLTWYPADWWLDRFEIDENWTCIRLEHLKSDLLKVFSDFEPINWKATLQISLARERNRNSYARNLDNWFSSADLKQMYEMNPRWTSLEVSFYGSTF